MLVYRSARKYLVVREALCDLEERLARLDRADAPPLDAVRSMLIDAGEIEAGLVDAECPERDDMSPLTAALDGLTGAVADVFVRSWFEAPRDAVCVTGIRRALHVLGTFNVEHVVEVSTPEGFAFYGLFPETYSEAANELADRRVPRRVVVIGIRSIGTTLSAVVAATLRARAIATERLTVRPQGHPFDRQLRLAPAMRSRLRELAAHPDNIFAIVDEGPGLSGSSFASVVEIISALGVPDERIVLLPSWNADSSALSNERARQMWPRHARFVGDFDRVWLCSGRLQRAFDMKVIRDLSAGAWRDCYFGDEQRPAIQPQHERRKFLARHGGEQMLIKFEGLDRGARERRARAEQAASAGFAPAVRAFAHGFLATEWVEGRPLDARAVTPQLLRRIAHYLAWVAGSQRTGRPADARSLIEMLRVNTIEGLGRSEAVAADRLVGGVADVIARVPAVRVDGRMFPHEWLQAQHGFIKTDVASHFDDHFYPGETDVAWDLAAAAIEWRLDAAETALLIREYVSVSRDVDIEPRLHFMRAAYAAFRLGYTTLGANALGAASDGVRLRDASRDYADLLRRELTCRVDGQSCATGT